MDIKEVMRRQYGPMPVWAWTALFASFVAGIVLFRKRMSGSGKPDTSGNGTSSTSPPGEFTSSQSSTTTDANGNQITTQYGASGPLTGFPGYITNQAGPMPYSGGDVYVNYPNQPAPPPQQGTTTSNLAEQLNPWFSPDHATAGAPWLMTVVNPGETWKDVTTRIYQFGQKYSDITDPTSKARIDQVADYIQKTNQAYTGLGPNGAGPAPGSVVVYR